uniref:Glycolipid transfer protein domain-containing protein n=1 Tax=Aegilops tauschii subsp. strangulata TaxID=200361 RepID=A0A453P3Y4_AEGTS
MAETVFAPCLEGMKHVRSDSGVMLAKPFLDVCKQILPVPDKFGAAMAIVKSDIGGNITVRILSSTLQTRQNMSTCTPWSKKKLKRRPQKVHQAVQMDFYGFQGNGLPC